MTGHGYTWWDSDLDRKRKANETKILVIVIGNLWLVC